MYNEYKLDGFKGVASKLGEDATTLKDATVAKARNIKNETVDNFNNLNNATKNTEKAKIQYGNRY